MRAIVSSFLLLAVFLVSAQSNPSVRISADPIKRVYRIIYYSETAEDVTITLYSNTGAELLQEKFPSSKTFVKVYSLGNLDNGTYEWQVEYGNKTYSETFDIQPQKKLLKESITAEMDNLLNLTVSVKAYNKNPVSIFLYKGNGEQLDHIFWEPTNDERSMVIKLVDYDAYDIRLEILQMGEVVLDETFSTY